MKLCKQVLMALPVIALTLGILGCSREKKDGEEKSISVTPVLPSQKAAVNNPNFPKEVDPLINEVVVKPEIQEAGPRSIAYFSSWSFYDSGLTLMDIDGDLLTHVNFAFAYLDVDGQVMVGDQDADLNIDFEKDLGGREEGSYGHFGQIRPLKEKYSHLKVLISIGGWSWSTNFSDVAADPVKRDRFAASAAEFVSMYGFDGVDIDWEYPVEGGDNITHRPEDNINFEMLLKATRKALNEQGAFDGKTYILSIAARASGRFIEDANLLEAMQYIDYINLMTYDFHGSWENITDFNTPLFSLHDNLSIDSSVAAYLSAGINPADINLGLAFYGKGWINVATTENNGLRQPAEVPTNTGFGFGTWDPGSFEAWDIFQNYVNKNGYVRFYDEVAQCPYVFNGNTWIGYDDEQSIRVKTEYAMEKGLGGVMFWDFSGDLDYILQKTIAETLGKKMVTNR
jgi:chitinase